MERIFHYLAAIFTRLLFLIHAVLMICWLVLVKGNGFYFVFLVLLVALVLETFYTVVFRKGHEHNGFCLSMFLYLMAVIPCDWMTKRDVLKCIVETRAENPGSVCQKAVSSSIGKTLMSVFPNSDDEVVIYTLEQALVLILVIGRWLLPKGTLSRDQLSQLLLVYVGVAADIIEFTEIIKEDEIRNAAMLMNNNFVNAVILFWSISLFQFTLTISATERSAQRIEKEKAQLEEEIIKLKQLEKSRRRNQIAPALYIHKRSASPQKVEEIKVKYIPTKNGLGIKPDTQESLDDDLERGNESTGNPRGCWNRFKNYFIALVRKCQDYVELVILLVPLIMQDGPYLIIRLIAIAYYKVSHSTLYFLTVKNALVVMLQVYRIFVLYYKPPDEDSDEISEFDHSTRLTNVQTAIKGIHHTRLAIRLVTRLQKHARWHSAGRSYNHLKKADLQRSIDNSKRSWTIN